MHTKNFRLQWLWVVPILLLTAILTARLLDATAIWVDEYWTYRTGDGAYFGPATPYSIIEGLITEDPWTVPAYFFAFNMWAELVGWSPFAIRAMSLLAGMLAVAWTYRLGRDVGGHHAGIGAALALAASAFFIHYIGEMRNYALMPVLAAFTTWAYWHMTHTAKASLVLQISFVLVAAVMPYMHYFAVLPLAGIALYHMTLLFTEKRAYKSVQWWRPLFLLAMSALLFLPWALLVTLPVLRRVATEGHHSPYLTWLDAPNFVLAFANGSIALVVIAAFYLVAGNTIRARHVLPLHSSSSTPLSWRSWRLGGSNSVFFAVFITLAAIIVAFVINQWRPILLYYRYLIAIFPLLALCAGLAMSRMIEAGLRPILVYGVWLITGLFAAFSPTFMDAYHNPLINAQPWHRIAPVMQRLEQPDDAALFSMPDSVWYVWQQFSADHYFYGDPLRYLILDSFPNAPEADYYSRVDNFLRDNYAPRLWNVYPAAQAPDSFGVTQRAIADHQYAACDLPQEVAGYRLELFTRDDLPVDAQFGDGIGLRLVSPLPAETGSTLDVTLGISVGADVPPETYSIALHLLGADGVPVAQTDAGLPYAAFSCRHFVINDIPAGEYTLAAVVYAWQTQERLQGTLTTTGETSELVPLGTIRVTP